jgi:hypothetical protein
MNSIVLFRFHAHFELCYERLKLIKQLNPSLPVYALYGGPPNDAAMATRCLAPLIDGLWSIARDDVRWKWLHQDIAVKEWYERYGHTLEFDQAYDYEYDLVLTGPLSLVRSGADGRSVAFSGLKLLSDVRKHWYWTSVEPYASGFTRYARFMAERYGLERQSYVTQGPFPVLPREFLEALCRQEYPDDVFGSINCETSYPGLAEALGFEIVDTGLHPGWTPGIPSIPVSRLFHCERTPLVSVRDILSELSEPSGRRAFHPVKEMVDAETIVRVLRGDGRCPDETRRPDAEE